MPRVGLLTIGQSPRPDIAAPFLLLNFDVREAGALDGLREEELGPLKSSSSEVAYISKLRTGVTTEISRQALLPLLANKLCRLEREVDVIVVVCTGSFPELNSRVPMIYPHMVVSGLISGLDFFSHLGLIVPNTDQLRYVREKWDTFPGRVSAAASSPYGGDDPSQAAIELSDDGAELIVLDCMGYSSWHRDRVRAATNLPVVLPQTLIAAAVQECFSPLHPKGVSARD